MHSVATKVSLLLFVGISLVDKKTMVDHQGNRLDTKIWEEEQREASSKMEG